MYQGKNILVIDLEMTGCHQYYNNAQEIIEVGLVMVERFEDNEIITSESFLVKPKGDINPYVSKMTGLYPEDFILEKEISFYREKINKYIEKADLVVFHGASEDRKAMDAVGINIPNELIFDTESKYRKLYPNDSKSNLHYVCQKFSISMPREHRAIADAMATLEAFRKINKKIASD